MSAGAHTNQNGRVLIWTLIATGLLVVAIANWRLVYLAETSQPDCVAHRRLGADASGSGAYVAARSACTP